MTPGSAVVVDVHLFKHCHYASSRVQSGKSFALVAWQEEGEGRSMAILSWIVFGLVIGIIAKLLMPGKDPGGFIVTILLGIAGALVGGFIGRAMGFYGPNQSAGWLISIVGAVILLALYRMLVRRRV
jgi:uncharacterized membrane protein YeaQ/YmgE (transglycosylase-associated protein family)